jgi:hypothetical protein
MDSLVDALRIKNNFGSKAQEGRSRLRVACNALRGELFNILEALDDHRPIPDAPRLQPHAETIDSICATVILAEAMLEKLRVEPTGTAKEIPRQIKLHLVKAAQMVERMAE